MKTRFLHLLFGLLLLCAQALAAAHVVEHAFEETHKSALHHHACATCHAAHNLAHALTGTHVELPVIATSFTPSVFVQNDRAAMPAPFARQQSPPFA
ncbi:MAG TPA: hypothetical protein VL550_01845 [Rhodocyclaceae bacterium]|nr:hypothetical protein [Rhodocyclaceae bacterium]